jgi:predicted GNAT family N-acyltransferase
MWEDPIVAEVQRVRREIFARFDGDMAAYLRYIRAQEEEERKRGRVIVDFSARGQEETDAA